MNPLTTQDVGLLLIWAMSILAVLCLLSLVHPLRMWILDGSDSQHDETEQP